MRTPKLFFIFLLLVAALAHAQSGDASRKEAQRLYQQADTDYKLQKYKEALENFQRSYELSKEPAILFNIGQCYRQLQQPLDAKKSFQFFVRDAPNHPKREAAEKLLVELDAELAHLATRGAIDVSSKQDPVEIYLDGARQGTSPLLLKQIVPGEHKLLLKKDGFSDAELTVEVNPAETSTVKDLQLAPLAKNVEVSRVPEKKFLIPAAVAAAGSAVALGGIFFFTGKAIDIQQNPEVSCNGNNLDEINACLTARNEDIQRAQSNAKLSARLSLGLFIGATIPLGVGFLAKRNVKENTQ